MAVPPMVSRSCASSNRSSPRRRAREQAEKKRDRESEALVKLAETSRLKIGQVVVQLQAVIAHSKFVQIPPVVADPINAAPLSDCRGRPTGKHIAFVLHL